jgi:hypothetical protein
MEELASERKGVLLELPYFSETKGQKRKVELME